MSPNEIASGVAGHDDRYIINWILISALVAAVTGVVVAFRWFIGRLDRQTSLSDKQTDLLKDLCKENMEGRVQIAGIVAEHTEASREFKGALFENTEFLKRNHDIQTRILDRIKSMSPLILLMFLFSGCTFARHAKAVIDQKSATNATALNAQVQSLNTGVVDSLSVAPTNAPTNLALSLARKEQQIVGVPANRIDVQAILSTNTAAIESLRDQFKSVDAALTDRLKLEATLREKDARLIEMGAKYEAEHNQNIVSRVWHWALSTLGVGGLIALCFLCPAAIPIIARIIAWIVGQFPKLAGAIGVVSTKAFDAVVKGVENAKGAIGKDGTDKLHDELAKSTDILHKALIDVRQRAVA